MRSQVNFRSAMCIHFRLPQSGSQCDGVFLQSRKLFHFHCEVVKFAQPTNLAVSQRRGDSNIHQQARNRRHNSNGHAIITNSKRCLLYQRLILRRTSVPDRRMTSTVPVRCQGLCCSPRRSGSSVSAVKSCVNAIG
jgi:hypothetical protein